jgi:hypothetical protein
MTMFQQMAGGEKAIDLQIALILLGIIGPPHRTP